MNCTDNMANDVGTLLFGPDTVEIGADGSDRFLDGRSEKTEEHDKRILGKGKQGKGLMKSLF